HNRGSAHDGSSKRSSDQARRPADRAGKTNDRQGSDALPRTAGAPSESRSSSPRATSGSSVPGQSRAARSRYRRAAGERARPRGPRTDQSSAANDRLEHAFRVKIRRTGHPARPDVPPSSHSPPASTTRVNQRSRILAITSFSTKSALSRSSSRDRSLPVLPLLRHSFDARYSLRAINGPTEEF